MLIFCFLNKVSLYFFELRKYTSSSNCTFSFLPLERFHAASPFLSRFISISPKLGRPLFSFFLFFLFFIILLGRIISLVCVLFIAAQLLEFRLIFEGHSLALKVFRRLFWLAHIAWFTAGRLVAHAFDFALQNDRQLGRIKMSSFRIWSSHLARRSPLSAAAEYRSTWRPFLRSFPGWSASLLLVHFRVLESLCR